MAEEFPHRRYDHQIENLAKEVRQHIESDLKRETVLTMQFDQMRKELEILNNTVSEIAGLFTQTKGALVFVKWIAAAVAAGAASWAWIMANLQTLHKG